MTCKQWAMLCHHPAKTGVGKHSVNPCLVTDARDVDLRGERPVQRVISPSLLGLTGSATGRTCAVNWMRTNSLLVEDFFCGASLVPDSARRPLDGSAPTTEKGRLRSWNSPLCTWSPGLLVSAEGERCVV